MSPQLFTVGHSTHPLDRFLALLAPHGVEALADIRRFPGELRPHTLTPGAVVQGGRVTYPGEKSLFA
jgi:hypothetical protein